MAFLFFLFVLSVGDERRTRSASPRSPPRPWIHLISSRPSSTLVGLNRHQAGLPWAEPIPRSKLYRRTSCFSSACWQFASKKNKWGRLCSCVRKNGKNQTFFPLFSHSGGIYGSIFSCFLKAVLLEENFQTSRPHCHRFSRGKSHSREKTLVVLDNSIVLAYPGVTEQKRTEQRSPSKIYERVGIFVRNKEKTCSTYLLRFCFSLLYVV